MKTLRKTLACIAAVAIAASAPCIISESGNSMFSGAAIAVSAESNINYVNSDGSVASPYDFQYLDSSMTHLSDGWYVVQGNVTINSHVVAEGDVNIIFVGNSSFTAKGGIEVTQGSSFSTYSQRNATGTLYAGTTTGRNNTAEDGVCGLGGPGCTINICGGAVFANGGSGAAGISGRNINIGWTNTTDSINASSYSGNVNFTAAFADRTGGAAFTPGSIQGKSVAGVKLSPAIEMNSRIETLDNAAYIVSGNVSIPQRLSVNGTADIILSRGCNLSVNEGITVPNGATLNIFGSNGTLYAGTTNGTNMAARDNNSGIGSENGQRAGNIIISGGNIYANGGGYAAGLGGNGAYIEIKGGSVNAKGGQYGAGIGSGFKDSGSEIRISGGNVSASGGSSGAGIGSGYSSGNSAISLGWTRESDSIYASSYNGNISFRNNFTVGNGGAAANSGNIGGKTITPSNGVYYSVTFDSTGGSYVAPVSVAEGKYLTVPAAPTKPGARFGGWYLDRNCTQEFLYNVSPIYKNYTLYAKWITSSHTVSFYTNGGDYVAPVTVNDGGYITRFPTCYRNGYTFDGWYYDSSLTQRAQDTTPIYRDTVLYAKWKTSAHTVSFYTNGGDYVAPVTVNDGGYISRFPTCYRNGYTFDGWYYDSSFTQRAQDSYPIYKDTVLYAKWKTSAHSVSFYTNGGSYVSPITVNDGEYITRFPTCYRDGYTFEGWYYDSSCTQRAQDTFPIYRDTVLYAKWSQLISNYTVDFVSNGGSYCSPVTVRANEYMGYLPQPTKANCSFNGWYTDSSCTVRYNSGPVTRNMTLYAGWSENVTAYVTVTFNSNGGSYVPSQTVVKGSYVSEPSCSRPGYRFTGWYVSSSGSGSPFYFSQTIDSNITLYAGWVEDGSASLSKGFSEESSSSSNESLSKGYYDSGSYYAPSYGSTFAASGVSSLIAGVIGAVIGALATLVIKMNNKK